MQLIPVNIENSNFNKTTKCFNQGYRWAVHETNIVVQDKSQAL